MNSVGAFMLDATTQAFLAIWDDPDPVACFEFEALEPYCLLTLRVGGDTAGVPMIEFKLPPMLTGKA